MSDFDTAVDILDNAKVAITEGAANHGDAEESFKMIGQMWQAYLGHVFKSRGGGTTITPFDVAQMMIIVKLARATYGFSLDNHVDIAGYSALSGMLNPFMKLDTEMKESVNGRPVQGDGSAYTS
jgi:hypothetical protein